MRPGCRRLRIIAWTVVVWCMVPMAVVLWREGSGGVEVSDRISSAATMMLKRGYFRTGQWRADARTLVAAARWCFEPDVRGSGNASYSNGVPVLGSTNAVIVTRT